MVRERFDWEVGDSLTPMGKVDGMGRLARGAARFGRRPGGRWVWVAVAVIALGAVTLMLVGLLAG